MKSRIGFRLTWGKTLLVLIVTLWQLSVCGVTAQAADYDVVGVLAIAVEPDSAEQLGLTPNQLAQLQDLIADKEAEILASSSELRNLTPAERSARLADFRLAAEEAGLRVLSAQQRAKLEQIRLKRYGLRVLTDPVVARRLQISPEQAATIQQTLAQRATNGGVADNGGAGGDEIIQVLNESQRQAFRSMLLGELPASPAAPANGVVMNSEAQPVDLPDDEEAPSVSADLDDDAPVGMATPVDAEPSEDIPPAPVANETATKSEESHNTASAAPSGESKDTDQPAATASQSAVEERTPESQTPSPPSDSQVPPGPAAGTTETANQPAIAPVEKSDESAAETPKEGEAKDHPETKPGENQPSTLAPAEPTKVEPPKVEDTQSGTSASPSPVVPPPDAKGEGPAPQAVTVMPEPPKPAEPKPAVGGPSPGDVKGRFGERPGPLPPGLPGTIPGMAPPPAPQPAAPRPEQVAGPGQTPSADQQIPQLPSADVKLRFNFRYQPWKEVLDWLARQAGLSLVMEAPPPGTFNYVDDHEFTPAQAIDLLNSVLLTKGYVLVRRERMLILFNVDDGIPPNLVDTVSPEDLDNRGDYEMVSCLFQLRRMTPEEAEQEVKKLLGPQGSVVVLAKAKQLFVTETAGRLKTIRRMLDAIENPSANDMVRTFRINPSTVDQVLSIIRQMFQIPADQTANADGTLRFAIDPSASRLLVSGSPEMLDRFSQLLQALDPSATDGGSALESTPQLEVYPITSADPQMVLQVLQTLLAGLPDVRLAIDPKTGALVAWARPAQHATIRATLQQLQGEVGQVEVIPLRVVDPQLAVLAISKLFGTGDSASGGAPTVDADLSTRMLLVKGTKGQIEQIRQLLIKMGEPADTSGSANLSLMRTIPMDAATAQAVLDQMQNLWPQVRPNRLQVIRSVVPADAGRPSPAANDVEQSRTGNEQTNGGIESQRIPLPSVMTSSSRLVLGLSPQRSTSSTSTTSSSTSSPAPQQPSFPQPIPGQPPFFRPWGPPGGFSPGGPGGFFERRSDGGDRGYDRWRGSDRTTYAHGDNIQLAESGDALGVMSSSGDSPTGRPWAPVVFVSQESKVVNEGNSTVLPDLADSSSQQVGNAQTSSEPSPEASAPSETGEKRTTESPAPLEGPPSAPPVIVAITPEGLVVASQDPEALNQFENLVRRMVSQDVTQYGGPELVVYYLKNSKAESVASILDQILGGGTLTTSGSGGGSLIGEIARAAFGNVGGGLVGSLLGIDTGTTSSTSSTSSTRTTSRIQITPDSRLNALIVQAYPQDLQLIEEILRVLDQPESPQDVAVQPKTIIIPVKNTQAEEIANILRSVYQDRLVTAASANRGPSPQEIIQLLRGGGRGGPGGPGRNQPTEEVQRMSIGVDVRTNSLIISAPERLLNEVRQLVEQLDQKAATDSEETTQVVTLQRASPESVRAALSALLGSGVQIRGSTSSSRVTSSSSTSSSGRSSSFSGRPQFQPGSFGFPFGQTPFGGGFSRSSPFGSSSQFGRSSGFSGRSGGR